MSRREGGSQKMAVMITGGLGVQTFPGAQSITVPFFSPFFGSRSIFDVVPESKSWRESAGSGFCHRDVMSEWYWWVEEPCRQGS
ncbi:hypothetical protein RchiOBHm_Chr5g0078041 [Rosa chinensis]|uniref:Uncharacterized protein n=1 Tax=Rosa chinensis TaxID=74649 RepID=A0A2P6QM65_ROSCH|nr:hypothetical protein RchiOBHm_Chr5g0078041 [Rosa chinensis]